MHKGHEHGPGCCGGHHPHDADETLAGALAALKAAGMRVTGPRTAMLRALAEARSPLTVEEVRRAAGENADLVTAYRTMESLEKLGLVRRHLLESGKSLYELSDPKHPEHHHHVICRVCGKMEPLPGCQAAFFENIAGKLGYTDLTHVLEVFGVCPGCAQAQAKSKH